MTNTKLRRQIAFESARLIYFREETEYYRAKQKAAKRLCKDWIKPSDLPTNVEIRDEVQTLARIYEGSNRVDDLLQMQLVALRTMRLLQNFSPRLIGSVLTGHVRSGSDIDIHVFSDHLEPVTGVLDSEYMSHTVDCESTKATKSCCCFRNATEEVERQVSSHRHSKKPLNTCGRLVKDFD